MISLTFESRQFRVSIRDCQAYVETREGGAWKFRTQHPVPVPPDALKGRNEFSMLTAALRYFERRGGDRGLREALTGGGPIEQPCPQEQYTAGGMLPSRV